MRLIDANILMYASFDAFPQHVCAKKWLDDRLNDGTVRLGIPWESITAFVRLASNPKIMQPPISVDKAWKQVESWLNVPCTWIPTATTRHRHYLDSFLSIPNMNHKLVADAHLAALAMEHGLILVSADADFLRFPGIRYENPISRYVS